MKVDLINTLRGPIALRRGVALSPGRNTVELELWQELQGNALTADLIGQGMIQFLGMSEDKPSPPKTKKRGTKKPDIFAESTPTDTAIPDVTAETKDEKGK